MAYFFITIVPNLRLKNGNHTVRIAVTHSGQTRYIPTDVTISSEKEFKNGKVVKRPDKDALNLRLRSIINRYEEKAEHIRYAETLTCSQFVRLLKAPTMGEKRRTFSDIADEYLSTIDKDDREKTYKLYRLAANRYTDFAGKDTLMEHVNPLRINGYIMNLHKSGLSPTSINIYVTLLKVIINYAVKMKYVSFEVDPFVTAKIPSAKKRDTYITVEQLKRIRDAELGTHSLSVVRDIFMLTYYLAGMNLVDMLEYDFRNTDEIYYVRKKTRHTKEGDNAVNFTIPDEAKPIIAKYMDRKTGKLVFGRYRNYTSCYNVLARKIRSLAEVGGIKHRFTLYSARKSFAQYASDLGIPDAVIDFIFQI